MSSMMYFLFVGCLLVFCQLQPLRAAPGADDPAPPKATAVTVAKLTPEDERTLALTGRLSVVEAGTGIYVPGPIKYPCGQTWASWWRQNYWYFQCLANQSCRPYRGCWCNLCACYMFIVYPTNPPCPRWTPWDYATSVKLDGYTS